MRSIVGVNLSNGIDNFFHRRKREEAITSRQDIAETCFLRNHRPPARKISRAAIAEPATTQANVLVFGDGEFSTRARNVLAIGIDVAGKTERGSKLPVFAFE